MAHPGLFASGLHAFEGWRARRLRWRTQRIMEGLPAGIRKDIGWPDAVLDIRQEMLAGPRGTTRRG